jgi:hypothetical protein
MAGKMMSNAKWSAASKAAKAKGTTLTAEIAKRDKGDKTAQKNINEFIAAGDEATREGRADKMGADVMSDYNKRVDENARAKMKVTNDVLDKTSAAALDVMDSGREAIAKVDSMKKKKTMVAGE